MSAETCSDAAKRQSGTRTGDRADLHTQHLHTQFLNALRLHALRLAEGRSHKVIELLPANDLGVLTQQAYFIEHCLDELYFGVQTYNAHHWVSHFEGRQVVLVNKVRRKRPGAMIVGSSFVPKFFPKCSSSKEKVVS